MCTIQQNSDLIEREDNQYVALDRFVRKNL